MESLGGGIAALAFWGFIAAVVVGGIWYSIREKEAQHETMRRIIESGQPIDQELIDRVFRAQNERPDRQLRIGGLIVVFAAPGIAALGWFISHIAEEALMPMLGVAALIAFVGVGLLAASHYAARAYKEDDRTQRP